MTRDWPGDAGRPFRRFLSKAPEITLFFWIIKVLATTVGETFADLLSDTLGLGLTLTTVAMTIALLVALLFQFRAQRYIPGLYWLVVVLISIVGTLFTDNLVDNIGVPLEVTAAGFAVALAATFVLWYRTERSLSVHTIDVPRREGFYWLASAVFGEYEAAPAGRRTGGLPGGNVVVHGRSASVTAGCSWSVAMSSGGEHVRRRH